MCIHIHSMWNIRSLLDIFGKTMLGLRSKLVKGRRLIYFAQTHWRKDNELLFVRYQN